MVSRSTRLVEGRWQAANGNHDHAGNGRPRRRITPMTDRKKPGVAFWATVVVVVGLMAYALSFGPAVWLVARGYLDKRIAERAYWPALCAYPHCQWLIRGYGELG